MDKYQTLILNPPKLQVPKESKQIMISLISCMCDNHYTWEFRKDSANEWKLNTKGYAYSNFQLKVERWELEWAADAGDWEYVFDEINKGVQKVESIRTR